MSNTIVPCSNILTIADVNITTPAGLCVEILRDKLVVDSSRPRALSVHNDKIFCLERGGAFNEWATLNGYVMAYDMEGIDAEILVNQTGLTHGLAVSRDHLYAASADTVYRWSYNNDDLVLGESTKVVANIPSTPDQALHTRSLLLDGDTLYVSVGAEQDVTPDVGDRAAIRAFSLKDELPLDWNDGTVVATGLRNAVGMAIHPTSQTLWALDTSADEKYREDLGGDLSENNPADELNQIANPQSNYGFPFCWSEYQLEPNVSRGRGSQWAWHDPDIFPTPKTDAFCRDDANNVPPQVVFPAHSVPLGMAFYSHQEVWPEYCPDHVALPSSWDGHAFVALHGSYFGQWKVPGSVVRVPISAEGDVLGGDGGVTEVEPIDVLSDVGPDLSGIRPVDVKFDACGRLLVTSDGKTRSLEGRMILRISGTDVAQPQSGASFKNGIHTLYALLFLVSIKLLYH